MKRGFTAALVAALWASAVVAGPGSNAVLLPANSEIRLSVDEELSSSSHRAGDSFALTVMEDVVVDGVVVVPKGTPARGEVTWQTGKGVFGKSGKLEYAVRHIDLAGRALPVEGGFREAGKGNKTATIWGVILFGPLAAVITGRTATVARGEAVSVRTSADMPLAAVAPQPGLEVALAATR